MTTPWPPDLLLKGNDMDMCMERKSCVAASGLKTQGSIAASSGPVLSHTQYTLIVAVIRFLVSTDTKPDDLAQADAASHERNRIESKGRDETWETATRNNNNDNTDNNTNAADKDANEASLTQETKLVPDMLHLRNEPFVSIWKVGCVWSALWRRGKLRKWNPSQPCCCGSEPDCLSSKPIYVIDGNRMSFAEHMVGGRLWKEDRKKYYGISATQDLPSPAPTTYHSNSNSTISTLKSIRSRESLAEPLQPASSIIKNTNCLNMPPPAVTPRRNAFGDPLRQAGSLVPEQRGPDASTPAHPMALTSPRLVLLPAWASRPSPNAWTHIALERPPAVPHRLPLWPDDFGRHFWPDDFLQEDNNSCVKETRARHRLNGDHHHYYS